MAKPEHYRDCIHDGKDHPGGCLEPIEGDIVPGIRVKMVGDSSDTVHHPLHYNVHPSGVECIRVVEWFNFNIGNAIKYLWRSDHKNGLEDLKKARWYINREIARLEAESEKGM